MAASDDHASDRAPPGAGAAPVSRPLPAEAPGGEDPFRLFFEAATVGMTEVDPGTGRILRANPAACALFGYSETELLGGMTFLDLTHPDDRERNRERHRRLLAGGESGYTVEKRYRRKDGTEVLARVTAVLTRTAGGRPLRNIAVIHDVRERKRADERLRLAQEAGQVATWDWDIRTNAATCSPSYFRLYGLEPSSTTPSLEEWLSRIHPEDRSRAAATVERALAGAPYEDEFRVVWPNGEVRWLAGRGTIERDADGRPVRMIGANVDITASKRAEERARMLHREMSHRVTNGFQLLTSLLRLQRRTIGDRAAGAALDTAVARVEAMALIHHRLGSRETVGVEPLDTFLDALCAGLRDAFLAGSRRRLVLDPRSGANVPTASAVTIGLLTSELVINACKHAHRPDAPGTIHVRLERVAEGCRLTVADDGAGLPPDLDPLRAQGLGMSIVQAQVRQLDGRLEIDRTPPGVRFTVTFPLPQG
jgi:PAS domain S-box-containing protein